MGPRRGSWPRTAASQATGMSSRLWANAATRLPHCRIATRGPLTAGSRMGPRSRRSKSTSCARR
eukprot:3728300-Lingulodinium_polyedra.AAC.1